MYEIQQVTLIKSQGLMFHVQKCVVLCLKNPLFSVIILWRFPWFRHAIFITRIPSFVEKLAFLPGG